MTTVVDSNGTGGAPGTNDNSASNNHQKKIDEGDDADNQDAGNEDDVIGLDIVDVFEDEENHQPRRRSWDRSRGRDAPNTRDQERERDRDNFRGRRRSRSNDKRRSRSDERKNEARRDPNKSNKDIEQDKMKAKKDNDSKILAEKEKAIKTLLDSDEVVPPGTEGEAIQVLAVKTQQQKDKDKENDSRRNKKSPEQPRKRSRTPIRDRLGFRRRVSRSPIRRSPLRSPIRRRSPITFSPDRDRRRRRSPLRFSPDDRRRRSPDRDGSLERRRANRRRIRERERLDARRRSRSRERHSNERNRSNSGDRRRRSRSYDRHSPARRNRRRSSSRSPARSPNRGARKRSPFLSEIARKLQSDSLKQDSPGVNGPALPHPVGPPGMHALNPGAPPFIPAPGGPPGIQPIDPRMIQANGGLLAGPGMPPLGPGGMPPGPMEMHPGGPMIHPGGLMPGPPGPPGPGFMGYDGPPQGPGMGFDIAPRGPADFPAGPVMYNQVNPMPPMSVLPHPMRPISPQPVPAPGQGPILFPGVQGPAAAKPAPAPPPKYNSKPRRSPSEERYRGRHREERVKTPEPPIISDFKPAEKTSHTSLSSLLEASVSMKDSSGMVPSFRGFRPEIVRQCEKALRSLPAEDPRLKMKGRFFLEPAKEVAKEDAKPNESNSILLRKGRTEIHWSEEENQLWDRTSPGALERKRVVTHQKICQTEEPLRESIAVQVGDQRVMADATTMVTPLDFQEESPRPRAPHPLQQHQQQLLQTTQMVLEEQQRLAAVARAAAGGANVVADFDARHEWGQRDNFDHVAKLRESDDLRWTLSRDRGQQQQQQGVPWTRGFSPNRQQDSIDHMHGAAGAAGAGVGGPMGLMDPRLGNNAMVDAAAALLAARGAGGIDAMGRIGIERGANMLDRLMNSRVMDARERLMEQRGLGMMGANAGMGMLDPRDMGDVDQREIDMDLMRERELIREHEQMMLDDFEMRQKQQQQQGFAGGFGGGGRTPMDLVENEQDDEPPMDDDPEELEIIEERLGRDKPWQQQQQQQQQRPAAFNNARGGAGAKRPFRGRIGGYRS